MREKLTIFTVIYFTLAGVFVGHNFIGHNLNLHFHVSVIMFGLIAIDFSIIPSMIVGGFSGWIGSRIFLKPNKEDKND